MQVSFEDCRFSIVDWKSCQPSAFSQKYNPAVTAESSSDLLQEFRDVDVRVPKRAFECITIDFVVKGKHNPSSVRMLHFDVAPLAVNLHEAEALQGGEHFPTGEQR
jgi:hypothetical protein